MAKEPKPEPTYEEKMLQLADEQVRHLIMIKETLWVILFVQIGVGIVTVLF